MSRWNLRIPWLVKWVRLTLLALHTGRNPPWPLDGYDFPRKRGQYEDILVQRYAEIAPADLRLDFHAWWHPFFGETSEAAGRRIRKEFNAALQRYLASVDARAEEGHVAPFLPEHFAWLVRRVVPEVERCDVIAVTPHAKTPCPSEQAFTHTHESEVYRKTLALKKFLAGGLRFLRPPPIAHGPRCPGSKREMS